MTTTTLLTLITPIVAPVVVALSKGAILRLPKWSLPLIAGLAGGTLDLVTALTTAHQGNFAYGAMLGLAGVGVRELIDQLTKADFKGYPHVWLVACAAAVFLCCGCSSTGMAKLAKELKGDQATISSSIQSVYGTVKFVRTNPGTNSTVTIAPDGTVTVRRQ